MSKYVIAVMQKGKRTVGYRVYDTDIQKYADYTTDVYKTGIAQNAFKVENVEVTEVGEIKGTEGVLGGYPKLDIEMDNIVGVNAFTIVGKTQDGLFKTVDGFGIPRDMREDKLVDLIKHNERRGLSNASIVQGVRIRCKKKIVEVGNKHKYTEKVFATPNTNGWVGKWKVRIVRKGEPYGVEGCLCAEGATLVEFIDEEHKQFVSRYFLHTLLEKDKATGLNLYGGEMAWSITAVSMQKILNWLRKQEI